MVVEQAYAGAVGLGPTTSEPGAAQTTPALAETYVGGSDMADDTPPDDRAKPVSRRVRFEVLRRDDHTCRYCGASAPDVKLTVDHVIPRSLGGQNDPSNLVTACRDCNAGKGSTSPDERAIAEVDERAERWAQAMEDAANKRRATHAREDRADADYIGWFIALWRDHVGYWEDWWAPDWQDSIRRFRSLGLDADDLRHAIQPVARNLRTLRNPFRYFCSMCWGEIEQRQSLALEILEGGDGAD